MILSPRPSMKSSSKPMTVRWFIERRSSQGMSGPREILLDLSRNHMHPLMNINAIGIGLPPQHIPKHTRHPRRDGRPAGLVKILMWRAFGILLTLCGTSLRPVTGERNAQNRLTRLAILYRTLISRPSENFARLWQLGGDKPKFLGPACEAPFSTSAASNVECS